MTSKTLLLATLLQAGPWLSQDPESTNLVTLTALMTKYLDKSNLNLRLRSAMAGKSQQPEVEAAAILQQQLRNRETQMCIQLTFSIP